MKYGGHELNVVNLNQVVDLIAIDHESSNGLDIAIVDTAACYFPMAGLLS